MIVAATHSPEETKALAASVAELTRAGDLILLAGDLGAGKTAFAQGFGRALGVEESITSPTFTLHRRYRGRLPLDHLDVYRLEQLAEVLDIGLPELLDEGGVILVEWGDAIIPALPADYLQIRIRFGEGDDDRVFELTPVGARWSGRSRALAAAVRRWVLEGGSGGEGAAPC